MIDVVIVGTGFAGLGAAIALRHGPRRLPDHGERHEPLRHLRDNTTAAPGRPERPHLLLRREPVLDTMSPPARVQGLPGERRDRYRCVTASGRRGGDRRGVGRRELVVGTADGQTVRAASSCGRPVRCTSSGPRDRGPRHVPPAAAADAGDRALGPLLPQPRLAGRPDLLAAADADFTFAASASCFPTTTTRRSAAEHRRRDSRHRPGHGDAIVMADGSSTPSTRSSSAPASRSATWRTA